MALILFESSIIAEIIRGGLNAVAKGQFEAAYSQGFGTVKTFTLIILPQAFKSVIPTLLGQVISTIKDSSYLANVAIREDDGEGEDDSCGGQQIYRAGKYSYLGCIRFVWTGSSYLFCH